jgi:hypothetical protein
MGESEPRSSLLRRCTPGALQNIFSFGSFEEGKMDQYTHAWIAFKAIERLSGNRVSTDDRPVAKKLVTRFEDYKDGVIRGAWYPDLVYHDNGQSHILKHIPGYAKDFELATLLPVTSTSAVQAKFSDPADRQLQFSYSKLENLPERCEALSHAVKDNLKIQYSEEKGSPLTPTGNHIALMFFALSHYIADAHVPMHCDKRGHKLADPSFGIAAKVEGRWGKEVDDYYYIIKKRDRFAYNPQGTPLRTTADGFSMSVIGRVEDELSRRPFVKAYGGARDVLDYIRAVTHFSFLLALKYLPQGYDPARFDRDALQMPSGLGMSYEEMSIASLADAIDAVARVWFNVYADYDNWETNQSA